jgi:hypothetical protein
MMARDVERFTMRFRKTLYRAGALALVLAPDLTLAASPSWYGTWILDRARSQLTGATIRIARIPAGYHFDFGAVSFDIGDDGKFYPTVPGRTTSLKAINANEWVRIHRDNGKDVDRSILRVSRDQNTLVIDTEATSPAGVVQRSQDVEQRVGHGRGLAGTWRSTKLGVNVADTITLQDDGGGRIRWGAPAEGNYFTVVPGGQPAINQGPRAVKSVELAVSRIAPDEMRWTETIGGKPYMEGADKLSGNGTLTETTWPDRMPMEKQIAVYSRR